MEDFETLEEENNETLQQLKEAELECITVAGNISIKTGRDPLGEINRNPLEIKFESSSGDLIVLDNGLDDGLYSVNLVNYRNYIVKIKYTTRTFPNWVIVDQNYRLDSDVSDFPQDW